MAENLSNSTSDCGEPEQYKNEVLGILYLFHGFLYYPFYLPCAAAIFSEQMIELSCYKLMGALAVVDMSCLFANAIIPGIWSILGTSFCQHYWPMKVVGAFGNGCWISYCGLCVSLSINRAVELSDMTWHAKLFEGKKTYYWIAGSFCWGASYLIAYLTPHATFIYHGGIGVYLFDPRSSAKIGNWMNLVADVGSFAVMVICYVVVAVQMRKLMSQLMVEKSLAAIDTIKNQRRVTITSVLICFFASGSCIAYPIVPAVTKETWVFTMTGVLWQITHGSNCFVYLLLNTKIRRHVKGLLGMETEQATAFDMVSKFMGGQSKAQGPPKVGNSMAPTQQRTVTKSVKQTKEVLIVEELH